MYSMMAYEAAIGRKEQIRVGTGQAKQHVEGYTVNGHEDWSRETRLGEELYPMSIVVIRHGLQNCFSMIHSSSGRQSEQMQDAPGVVLTRCAEYYHFITPSAQRQTLIRHQDSHHWVTSNLA
jgi:hypothetical protein